MLLVASYTMFIFPLLVRLEKQLDNGPALFIKPGPFNIRRFIYFFLISQSNLNLIGQLYAFFTTHSNL